MIQGLTYSMILCYIFFFNICSKRIVATDEANDFKVHEDFIDGYLRYRRELGCYTPLCSEGQDENVTKYTEAKLLENEINGLQSVTKANTSLTEINVTRSTNSSGCCSTCSCSPNCLRYGNCCPDKLTKEFISFSDYPVGGIFECGANSIKQTRGLSKRTLQMISKCNRKYKNDDMIEKCTVQVSDNLEDYRIVTHKTTHESYRNIHCAKCNFVTANEVSAWQIQLQCTQGMFLPSTMSEIISEVRQSNHCDVIFKPPRGLNVTPCQASISKCNETGLWLTNHSLVLEKACETFVSEFWSGDATYKNSYCYICNTGATRQPNCDKKRPGYGIDVSGPPVYVSFSALLDFTENDPSTIMPSDCEINYVYDYFKEICRKLICPSLAVLLNGSCKRVLHSTRGLTYKATIKLVPAQQLTDSPNVIHRLESYFKHITKNYTGSINLTIEVANNSAEPFSNQSTFIAVIQFKDDLYLVDQLIELDGGAISIPIHDIPENIQTERINETQKIPYYIVSQKQRLLFHTEILVPTMMIKSSNLDGNMVISKFLKCEMIELNLSTFQRKESTTGILFSKLNLFLARKDFLKTNESHIRVCAKNYVPATKHYFYVETQSSAVENDLSIVCLCLSVFCLIITIAVYSLFPELRTQPGLNNMYLSISLLLALVGLFIGGIQSVNGFWCSIVGLFVHFLWINSIFWLNVCCVHMFRTFKKFHTPIQKNLSWIYHAYCLTSSTVLINVNIIWSLSTSGGNTIGYGKHSSVCYILYPEMVAFTMTLPVGLIVTTNFILYMTVIYRIRKDSFQMSNRRSQGHFSVYIKLSTVTGISWLSYIPTLVSGNYVCGVIFSTLVASQGIFIMVAFVCNTRTVTLCRSFIKERQAHSNISKQVGKKDSDEVAKTSKEIETVSTSV